MKQEKSTSDRILNAAEELFREGGVSALSMRAISARIGLTAPAAYRHFAGKAEIVEAVIQRGFRRFMGELEKKRSGLSHPEDLLAVSLRHYMQFWAHDPSGFTFMLGREETLRSLSGNAVAAGSFGDIHELVSRIAGKSMSVAEVKRIGRWAAVSLFSITASIVMDGLESKESLNARVESAVGFIVGAVHAAARKK